MQGMFSVMLHFIYPGGIYAEIFAKTENRYKKKTHTQKTKSVLRFECSNNLIHVAKPATNTTR